MGSFCSQNMVNSSSNTNCYSSCVLCVPYHEKIDLGVYIQMDNQGQWTSEGIAHVATWTSETMNFFEGWKRLEGILDARTNSLMDLFNGLMSSRELEQSLGHH